MKLVFDTRGNIKQKECAAAWSDQNITEIIYGGGKGGAKSFTGCKLIFHDALVYEGTHYFIARKKLNDLRKFTIPSIHECFKDWGIKLNDYAKYNGQDNVFEFKNGSKVFLIEAAYMPSDPLYMRFGSMQMTRGWIEEAGEFEEEAKSQLSATVGRWLNSEYNIGPKVLQTCNPSKNYLYLDYKNWKDGKLESYKQFIQALLTDNKCMSDDYIKNLNKVLSTNQKKRLIDGEWEWDDDPLTMMDYNKILELFTNEFIKPTDKRYLTCDIAYEGSDIFAVGYWEGLVLKKVYAREKISEVKVPGWIQELRLNHEVPLSNVIYDADGIKKFVRSSKESGSLHGATEFHNGGSPVDKAYKNLKTECYYKLADYVNSNKIYIEASDYRNQIIQELEQIRKVEHSDDGKLRIESKDNIKLRLQRSPDFADMIMMRLSAEIKRNGARMGAMSFAYGEG